MSRALAVVAQGGPALASETVAQRVQRLQAEAKALAREHIKALAKGMIDLEQLAAEIADGGDAYPSGVRDVARRLVEDLESRVQTLEAISARAG